MREWIEWAGWGLGCLLAAAAAGGAPAPEKPGARAYLFSSFRDNGQDGLHLASSRDGYHWAPLNGDRSYLTPQVGREKLMRDPCIVQGPDGTFHMVWTCGWYERSIGCASSRDLVHWSEQRTIPVMEHEPAARCAWAPELFYDAATKRFLIFWASTIPGRFPATDQSGDNGLNHRIYYTSTRNFREFAPTKLFFDPGFSVIDATILPANGRFYLLFKDETKTPVKKHLRLAVSDRAEGPYADLSEPFTISWVEGPSAIRVGEEYLVYFDHYARPQYYGAMRSRDLKTWEDVSKQVSFPAGTRHGTIFAVSEKVLKELGGK